MAKRWTREGEDYYNSNGIRVSRVYGPVPGKLILYWAAFDLDGSRITRYRKYLKDAKSDADNERWT